ncbi:uncharacterized protein LOC132057875 [Lycium ferocissimum]|uniref:uncharacterized protein LOC132057875 n=1 Tax=Lycium ferocissimum TaxID=112874 RepID=UPI0028155D04|nr:uncharacterized protein LOC132057875 [Lycium ferocissimum]
MRYNGKNHPFFREPRRQIIFLKFKSEVASVFRKFKKLVETQSDCKIQALRSDNGKNTPQQNLIHSAKKPALCQLTTPYTPEQNGVSERRNKSIMEMHWDWETPKNNPTIDTLLDPKDLVDDPPVRGTRLISDIYQRCNTTICEPTSYEEAEGDDKWVAAMKEEMLMIKRNQTWELVEKPYDRKIIGEKWVFMTKLHAYGSIYKHKAILVVKG